MSNLSSNYYLCVVYKEVVRNMYAWKLVQRAGPKIQHEEIVITKSNTSFKTKAEAKKNYNEFVDILLKVNLETSRWDLQT